MSGHIPYNITTDAGQKLWTQINAHYGSSVWGPVGEGIVAVEKEITERIIAKLEAERQPCVPWCGDRECTECNNDFTLGEAIELLRKGE